MIPKRAFLCLDGVYRTGDSLSVQNREVKNMKRRNKGIRDEDGVLHSDKAVLALLLEGKSRDKICAALDMPMGTLNSCCSRIYKREGCNTLAQLLVKYRAQEAAVEK
jgi:DNA-binding CsgD family transcriptional regulator